MNATEKRLLLAYDDAIATRGKYKGQLKSKCPPMGTDGAIMWQAMQMNANPFKVSIAHLVFCDHEFYKLCQEFSDNRKAILPLLDRDRVALERMGAW